MAEKQQPSEQVLLVLKEGTMLGVLLLAVFCMVALFSYSPQDPGISSTGSNISIQNAMGKTGAWIADFLLSFIGYSAYVLPVLLILRAWLIFRDRYLVHADSWVPVALKFAGGLCLLLGLTSLFELSVLFNQEALPFGGGGYLGRHMNEALLTLFSPAAIALVMLVLALWPEKEA